MSKPQAQSEPFIDHLIDVARGEVEDPHFEREHRIMKRRPYTGPLWLAIIHSDDNVSAPIRLRGRNISPGGLCAISPVMVQPASECALMLARSDKRPAVVSAQAIYCNFIGPEHYEIGLEFISPSVSVGLDTFRDGQGKLPPMDVRTAA